MSQPPFDNQHNMPDRKRPRDGEIYEPYKRLQGLEYPNMGASMTTSTYPARDTTQTMFPRVPSWQDDPQRPLRMPNGQIQVPLAENDQQRLLRPQIQPVSHMRTQIPTKNTPPHGNIQPRQPHLQNGASQYAHPGLDPQVQQTHLHSQKFQQLASPYTSRDTVPHHRSHQHSPPQPQLPKQVQTGPIATTCNPAGYAPPNKYLISPAIPGLVNHLLSTQKRQNIPLFNPQHWLNVAQKALQWQSLDILPSMSVNYTLPLGPESRIMFPHYILGMRSYTPSDRLGAFNKFAILGRALEETYPHDLVWKEIWNNILSMSQQCLERERNCYKWLVTIDPIRKAQILQDQTRAVRVGGAPAVSWYAPDRPQVQNNARLPIPPVVRQRRGRIMEQNVPSPLIHTAAQPQFLPNHSSAVSASLQRPGSVNSSVVAPNDSQKDADQAMFVSEKIATPSQAFDHASEEQSADQSSFTGKTMNKNFSAAALARKRKAELQTSEMVPKKKNRTDRKNSGEASVEHAAPMSTQLLEPRDSDQHITQIQTSSEGSSSTLEDVDGGPQNPAQNPKQTYVNPVEVLSSVSGGPVVLSPINSSSAPTQTLSPAILPPPSQATVQGAPATTPAVGPEGFQPPDDAELERFLASLPEVELPSRLVEAWSEAHQGTGVEEALPEGSGRRLSPQASVMTTDNSPQEQKSPPAIAPPVFNAQKMAMETVHRQMVARNAAIAEGPELVESERIVVDGIDIAKLLEAGTDMMKIVKQITPFMKDPASDRVTERSAIAESEAQGSLGFVRAPEHGWDEEALGRMADDYWAAKQRELFGGQTEAEREEWVKGKHEDYQRQMDALNGTEESKVDFRDSKDAWFDDETWRGLGF